MPYGENDKAACGGLVPPRTLKKCKWWDTKLCLVSRHSTCKWGQILATPWHSCLNNQKERVREREGCLEEWTWSKWLVQNVFIFLKHHCQSILEKKRTCSIICPVKAHNHFGELFSRWRTPQWVRWISEDYANVERRNCESCSQSAETNPCAKRHHKTFRVFSLLSNKVLQEITKQKENGDGMK